jgi:hypothetical protein
MSVTIHYFGKLADPSVLPGLVEDFEEIARVSGWSFERVDHVFTREDGPSPGRLTLKGIRVTLAKTATPLLLTFDQEGHLAHIYYEPVSLEEGTSSPRRLLHQVHTHTTLRAQDPQVHVTLVKLLDHLQKRFVPNLEVIDNSGYWYSRDESLLKRPALELIQK